MITFSSLNLILSSAFANLCFFFLPLTLSLRGSLLLADFLFCFSFFLCIFNLFLVFHLSFFGGSVSWVSNLSFPRDITRLTEPWLRFLETHEGVGGGGCLGREKMDSGWQEISWKMEGLGEALRRIRNKAFAMALDWEEKHWRVKGWVGWIPGLGFMGPLGCTIRPIGVWIPSPFWSPRSVHSVQAP